MIVGDLLQAFSGCWASLDNIRDQTLLSSNIASSGLLFERQGTSGDCWRSVASILSLLGNIKDRTLLLSNIASSGLLFERQGTSGDY